MSRIFTPIYRVEYRDNLLAMRKTAPDMISTIDQKPVHAMYWDSKRDGRATCANLEAWRNSYNKSFQAGGSNEHVSKSFDAITHIHYARIVRQSTDEVICEVTMPTFEVV